MNSKIWMTTVAGVALMITGAAAKPRMATPANMASVVCFNLVKANATVTTNNRVISYTVNPGGNPNEIQLQFEGVDQVRLGHRGQLTLLMKDGELRSYTADFHQTVDGKDKVIDGNFRILGGNKAAFHVGKYDNTLPLSIEARIMGADASK